MSIEMANSDTHPDEAAFLGGGDGMRTLIAQHDWASTALGPLSAWPQSLKTATAILLQSPIPMALLWGEDGVLIYNDGYANLIAKHHPEVLGSKVLESWPENAELNDQALRVGLAGGTQIFRDLELTVSRSGEPEQIWMNVDCSPVPDESGRPAGVLAICVETTQRVLAERKAGREMARQRRMFEQAPGFICLLSGPDHVFEFVNEAHKRLFGDRDAVGKPIGEVFADIADQGFPSQLERVYATRERVIIRAGRALLPTPVGGPMEEHFLDFVLEPVVDERGEVTGIFFEGFDVTQQVRAQAAVEESNRRLNAAVAIARLGVFEIDYETRQARFDARARAIFGFGPDESLTIDDVMGRIDSNDLQRIGAQARADNAAGEARREREYRIHLPDGSIRDVISVSDHSPGPDGRPTRAVGVVDDVTERRRAEQRQLLLINELNHRVKNTLATVQSIAAQTLRSAPDLPSAREVFEARLVALAAAHDLLTAESWRGARLTDVAATAMAPFETMHRPQIIRSGPPVWLAAHRALALSLALHELATNAAKYGALSVPEGRVTIRWSVSGDELRLLWIEEGGPPVATPTRAGFGTRLLQRSLAHELHGEVAFTFAPEGVRCEIRCEVEDVGSAAAPEIVEGWVH
ncbi:PAS domain-containing protein [Phenylobacterium sp. LjRoot225]|uniref:PAS domain-containing sensor histidine kinase n=1 Tax=Phenylobacterium sp. LjRoot225 TaxID=3342285 RepID=UPI003ECFD5A4